METSSLKSTKKGTRKVGSTAFLVKVEGTQVVRSSTNPSIGMSYDWYPALDTKLFSNLSKAYRYLLDLKVFKELLPNYDQVYRVIKQRGVFQKEIRNILVSEDSKYREYLISESDLDIGIIRLNLVISITSYVIE